jgi:hypothetical protein
MVCSILTLRMKQVMASAALLAVLISTAGLFAAEKQYEKGQIAEVEKKAHTRVLYYLVNTPVTQDDPYYEVSLQLKDALYVTEYTPRHAADSLPDEWKAGAEVQARLTDKHHMSVKGPGGRELQLVVVKRTPGVPEAVQKPASSQN